MAKVLIVGLGYIGLCLAEKLKKNEHEVIGVCRTAKPIDCQQILKDVHSLSTNDLPQGLDYVFYMISADSRTIPNYELAYPKGVHHLLTCLEGQSIKRFFYISSTGVYPNKLEIQDEKSKIIPDNDYAKILLEAERLALASRFNATVIRFGGLYGPGRERLITSVQEGKAQLSDKPIFTNRIHQQDAAGVLAYLLQKENLENIYNAVDGSMYEYNEVIVWLAEQLGLTLTKETITLNRPSKKISHKRLLGTGYTFKYPSFKEGYKDMIEQ